MNKNPAKIFSVKSTFVVLCGIGLLTAGLVFFSQFQSQVQGQILTGFSTQEIKSLMAVPTAMGSGSSFDTSIQPARLIIPSIGVNVEIEGVGLSKTGNGAMGIPTKITDVAWYSPGTIPGMPGSAVIAGHLNGKVIGSTKGVFYNLDNLKINDVVEVVNQKGNIIKFLVVSIKIYDHDASAGEVFSSDVSKARLNLITCSGEWIKSQKIYNKRTVVFTELLIEK